MGDNVSDDMNPNDDDLFVPSATFRGSRTGFYFGTGPRGTGYYRDDDDDDGGGAVPEDGKTGGVTCSRNAADNYNNSHPSNSQPPPPPAAKRAKRTVLFDDGKNTTLEYDADDAALRQLEEAEKAAAQQIVVDLTPRGVKVAVKHLVRAHQANAVLRAQHEDEPQLYMDSEVSLYEHLHALKGVAADPAALYPVVVGAGDGDDGPAAAWDVPSSACCWSGSTRRCCCCRRRRRRRTKAPTAAAARRQHRPS
jgi:Catenin-beta-like, Arm-motif containing nuclear